MGAPFEDARPWSPARPVRSSDDQQPQPTGEAYVFGSLVIVAVIASDRLIIAHLEWSRRSTDVQTFAQAARRRFEHRAAARARRRAQRTMR